MIERMSAEDVLVQDPGTSVRTVLVPVSGPQRSLQAGLDVKPGSVQLMRVLTGQHSIALGLNTRVVNDHLVVSFHGVRADLEVDCAALRNLTWADAIGSAVLALSDPLCESAWPGQAPRGAGYCLSLEGDPDAEINALIDRVAAELSVAPERVVLSGNSIGAAAAMRIAARRPVGRAVICNPLTDVDGLRRYVDAWLRRMGCTRERFDTLRAQSPGRFEAVAAWQHGLAAGHDLRLVVLQAVGDRLAQQRQHPNLCAALGLDAQRGGPSANGRVLLVLHEGERHGLEPTQAMHQLARQVFETPLHQVQHLSLAVLRPGTWFLDAAVTEQFQEERHASQQARRRSHLSQALGDDVGASGATVPAHRPPLLPPASSGVLLLAGSPTVGLKAVARVMKHLPGTRRLADEPLVDGVRRGGPLGPGHLCDEDGPTLVGDGEWLVGAVRPLFQNSPAVLSHLDAVRVLYLMRDPLEAVAERLREPDAAVDEQLDRAIEEWNHAAEAVVTACHGADGARIRVMAEDSLIDPLAWAELLAWMGRTATPELVKRAQRALQRQGGTAQSPWPAGLDAAQRRRLLLGLDWGAYRRLVALCG